MADPEIVDEGKGKKPKGGGKEEGGEGAKKNKEKKPLPSFLPALIVGVVGIFAAVAGAFFLVKSLTPREITEESAAGEKAGEGQAEKGKDSKGKRSSAKDKSGGRSSGSGEKSGSVSGNLYSFDKPVIVNLAETNGERYLKVMFSIEMEEMDVVEELEAKKPQIMDMLINILSAKTLDSIATTSGRNMLRQEIIDKINALLENGRISNIYFTEFVVQ
jgi:flagellar FliL protein